MSIIPRQTTIRQSRTTSPNSRKQSVPSLRPILLHERLLEQQEERGTGACRTRSPTGTEHCLADVYTFAHAGSANRQVRRPPTGNERNQHIDDQCALKLPGDQPCKQELPRRWPQPSTGSRPPRRCPLRCPRAQPPPRLGSWPRSALESTGSATQCQEANAFLAFSRFLNWQRSNHIGIFNQSPADLQLTESTMNKPVVAEVPPPS